MSKPAARPAIEVLFFGSLAEAIGARTTRLPAREGLSVGDALTYLEIIHPPLVRFRPSCLVAINEQWCDHEQPLKAGDVLAIMPPVSGG